MCRDSAEVQQTRCRGAVTIALAFAPTIAPAIAILPEPLHLFTPTERLHLCSSTSSDLHICTSTLWLYICTSSPLPLHFSAPLLHLYCTSPSPAAPLFTSSPPALHPCTLHLCCTSAAPLLNLSTCTCTSSVQPHTSSATQQLVQVWRCRGAQRSSCRGPPAEVLHMCRSAVVQRCRGTAEVERSSRASEIQRSCRRD